MIIGTGMIAKAFKNYENDLDIIIFASGVSNSTNATEADYIREKQLLESIINKYPKSTLVYFSTCSIHDPELNHCSYVSHKLAIEKFIQEYCKNYFIFRLSQVVGKTNSPTLINFFVYKIVNKEPFYIWEHSTRNLIDVMDVFKISDYCIKNSLFLNEITNIATPFSLPVFSIVSIVEELCGYKGIYDIQNRGGSYNIDIKKIASHLDFINISFNEDYPYKIIKKYFFS